MDLGTRIEGQAEAGKWPLLVQEEREAAFTGIATDATGTDIEFKASVGLG